MSKPKILKQLDGSEQSQILLTRDPTANMDAATKQYVDNTGDVFYAIYGATAFSELIQAYNLNKTIIVNYNFNFYPLIYFDNTVFVFIASSNYEYGLSPNIALICSNAGWNIKNGTGTSDDWTFKGATFSGEISTTNNIKKTSNSTAISSSTRYYRPILVSTSAPTSSDGDIGDIWLVYKA